MSKEEIKRLADEYAALYHLGLTESYTAKRAELHAAIDKLEHDSKNHECASHLLMAAVDELEKKLRAASEGGCAVAEDFES